MTTELKSPGEVDLSTSQRSLLLVWQSPASGKFVKVGRLDLLAEGKFAFYYVERGADDAGFVGLDDYPDRNGVYVSDELPAFFANRVMSTERPSYATYLRWLGIEDLGSVDLPIEVLARTGGGRVTDTFHVLDVPVQLERHFTSRFFVSGVRHTESAQDVIAALSNGSSLALQLDEENPENPLAVLINAADGRKVGFVPDWLCADVHDLIKGNWTIAAAVDRVNPDAPDHVKVLCRIEASRD